MIVEVISSPAAAFLAFWARRLLELAATNWLRRHESATPLRVAPGRFVSCPLSIVRLDGVTGRFPFLPRHCPGHDCLTHASGPHSRTRAGRGLSTNDQRLCLSRRQGLIASLLGEGKWPNSEHRQGGSWWTTLPGILTGLAAMVTAVGSFLVVLSQLGLLPKPQDAPPLAASKPRAETPAVAPPPELRTITLGRGCAYQGSGC